MFVAWSLLAAMSFFICLDQAQANEHICTLLTRGAIDQVHIHSITYYKDKLVLFVNSHKYYIPLANIGKQNITLPGGGYAWDGNEMTKATSSMASKEHLRAAYMMFSNWKGVLNVVTSEEEYIWDITEVNSPLTMFANHQRTRPDYAIVHDQVESNVNGYVINRDIYSNTLNFVIYQLWLDESTLDLQTHRLSETNETKTNSAFYYMQRTERPNEVRLVHRANLPYGDTQSELFYQLPRGFIFGDQMYLFDTELLCLYIIPEWTRSQYDLYKMFHANKSNITKTRVNVPYEKFFVCNGDDASSSMPKGFDKKYAANRCETTLNSRFRGTGSSVDSFLDLRIAVFITISVVAIAAVIGFIVIARRMSEKHADTPPALQKNKPQPKGQVPKSQKAAQGDGKHKKPSKTSASPITTTTATEQSNTSGQPKPNQTQTNLTPLQSKSSSDSSNKVIVAASGIDAMGSSQETGKFKLHNSSEIR